MKHTHTWRKLCALALAVLLLVSVMPAVFAAGETTTVYLDPNPNWKEGNARFAVYYWNSEGDNWIDMVADGDYYKADVPNNAEGIIFCRMNPANTENSWNTKWNQSGNLTVPTDNKTCFSVPFNDWDNSNGDNWYVKGQEPDNSTNVVTGPVSYYVAGVSGLCGSNWNEKDEANKMAENADGLYEKTYTNVPAGTYEFKVTDGSWTDAAGDPEDNQKNYSLVLEVESDVTILCSIHEDTKKPNKITVKITPKETAPTEYTVTLHFMPPKTTWGEEINAWIWTGSTDVPGYEDYHKTWPGKKVEADKDNPGWYTLTVKTTLGGGFSFIFSGKGEGNQTADLTTGALTGDLEVWYFGDKAHTTKPDTKPEEVVVEGPDTGESVLLSVVAGLMVVSAVAFVTVSKKKF